ncbi:MAG: hypothetical protein JSS64_02420, partial [Bacteroidetes bacterium]|nr:hypothetical protein [Bacteroidota bacterium]
MKRRILQKIGNGVILAFLCLMWQSALAQTTVTIGGTGSTSSYIPIFFVYEYSYSQTILSASELNTGGAAGAGYISKLRWKHGASVATPGFSNFYVMSSNFPLAIDLKTISATNVGTRNRVDWATGVEKAGDAFEVERSVDGRNFTYLASIKGKGEASTYSYWDQSPVTGVNYYRLKLVNVSGVNSYSNVVTATVKSGSFTVEA